MTSILNRLTGISLLGGAVLIVWWLMAAATSEAYFAYVDWLLTSIQGDFVMTLSVWALWYHALGGIRHLIWDMGRGFELPTVEWMAKANLAGSIGLTILLWIIGYSVR